VLVNVDAARMSENVWNDCKVHITWRVSRRCRLWVQENTISGCRTALQSASRTARIEPSKKLAMRARHALRVKILEHWLAAYR